MQDRPSKHDKSTNEEEQSRKQASRERKHRQYTMDDGQANQTTSNEQKPQRQTTNDKGLNPKQQAPTPILILNWNGLDDTLECMDSLLKQSHQDFIIYLADNGSTGDDQKILQEKFGESPKIKLRFFDENHGFTKAHNILFEEVLQGDVPYLITLNNDTIQESDWLEKLLAFAERQQADMISCKMINYFDRSKMDNAGHRMLNTAEIIPYASGESVNKWNKPFENLGPCAGAALYSTEMLRKIGTFDPFFETGYEDAELGLRACILGYKAWYCPDAVVYHKVSASINKVMDYDYKLKIQKSIFYTWFKLMPKGLIGMTKFSFYFKYGMVFLIDIILRRKIFYQVMKDAFAWKKGAGAKQIKAARDAFYTQHKPISSFKIRKRLQFFLFFDISRFWKFVVLKEKSFFER